MITHNKDGRVYDLNISEKYVPEWGSWEVGREVISNAIDADKLGYQVKTVNKDHLQVITRTRPTLAQIKFIGGGTKNNTTGTIGCFGEGIKLAAMVCQRLGGEMKIAFDQYEVSYELVHDEDLGYRSIIMHVKDSDSFQDGMVVDIFLENICSSVSGKFLPAGSKEGMIEKVSEDKMIIYNKGVFVAEKPTKSLWDWNLNTSINRDRNVIDMWDIGSAITSLLDRKMTTDIATHLLESPSDMFEVECIEKHRYNMGKGTAQCFLDAFKKKHGTDIVIATDNTDANRLARRLGKKVVVIDNAFRQIIMTISPEDRVPSAEEVISHEDRLEINYSNKYDVKDLDRLVDILEIPVEIFVFEGDGKKEFGLAEFKNGKRRVYMNSILWEPGYSTKKLETFVHELAHVNSKASDGEFSFESELSRIGGVLAKEVLN